MAETHIAHMYQFCRQTYFLPVFLVWPLSVGLHRIYSNLTTSKRHPKTVIGPNRKCRYRLDNDTSAVLNLPNGRKLGYAQYGAPNGKVVFYTHGFPGSRLEGATWEKIAKKHNARIISVDRPGIGWSSPQPGRRMIDHATDIGLLADHLELKEYFVMGISGGGPYALACAAALPADKLKAVTVVVGLGRPDMNHAGMKWSSRIATYLPESLIPLFASVMFKGAIETQLHLDDELRLEILREHVAKEKFHHREFDIWKDAERSEDDLRLTLKSMRQAFGQGHSGIGEDGRVLSSRDQGFRLEDIRHDLPIQLWYGKYDVNVPPVHGEQYAARLGPKVHLRIEDETHGSMQYRYQEEFLETLLKLQE